ncbi:MAG: thioesterase family protein [Pseudomonadota bacterium]
MPPADTPDAPSTTPQAGLETILASEALMKGGYGYTVPDNWRQGRTTYGGLTAGLMLRSFLSGCDADLLNDDNAGAAAPQKEPVAIGSLRSASITFIGPVADDPVCLPSLSRRGRNVTSGFATMHAGDALVANGTFIFGQQRESAICESVAAPSAPAPGDCAPFIPEPARPSVPIFFHNFETRLIDGGRPCDGLARGYTRAWSRHESADARTGIVSFLTLADALPPAALAQSKVFAPISTINWLINIIEEPHTEDGWFQIEVMQTAARDGYSSQQMRFWNRQGDLIAEALQNVAIFF